MTVLRRIGRWLAARPAPHRPPRHGTVLALVAVWAAVGWALGLPPQRDYARIEYWLQYGWAAMAGAGVMLALVLVMAARGGRGRG